MFGPGTLNTGRTTAKRHGGYDCLSYVMVVFVGGVFLLTRPCEYHRVQNVLSNPRDMLAAVKFRNVIAHVECDRPFCHGLVKRLLILARASSGVLPFTIS